MTSDECGNAYDGAWRENALTLPNRLRMLPHLRRAPALQPRLLFGTDYPLSVLHLAAWGRVELCDGLGLKFRSFGDLIHKR